jgi:peptide/nickel transport system substrate-binding protein
MKPIPVCVALVMAVLSGTVDGGQAPEPRRGGSLRIGLRKDITNLNPFVQQMSTNALVRSLIYEGLTEVNNQLEVVPALAESWTISRDGKEYVLRLKKGVFFHNGKELDAEDVKWSLDHITDPKNRAYMQGIVSVMSKVDVEDRHTIKISLKDPFAPLLAIALSGDTLMIPKNSVTSGETPTAPPGTGPFQFVDWKERNQISLKANRRYWQKGTPYLDEITMKPIINDDVRFFALRAGDIDIIEVVPYQIVNEIKKGKYPEIKLAVAPIAGFRMIKMNVEDPQFSNPRVRKAVALALDRKAYIEGYAFGYGDPAYQVYPKGARWYFEEVKPIEADLQRAKAMLAEAGYPRGFKTVIHTRQGEEPENILIQNMLRKIGIELEIKVEDFAQHQKNLVAGDYSIRISGSDVYPDIDRSLYTNFHSEAGPRRVRNHTGYKNTEADRLLEKGRATLDPKERREIYRKVTEILADDSPQVNLAFINRFYGFRSNVKGFTTNANGALSHAEGGIPATWVER